MRVRVFEAICGGLILAAWVLAAQRIPGLPATVPITFALDGTAKASGAAATLWVFPAFVTGMYLLLSLAQLVPVRMMNLPVKITERNREGVYALAREMMPALKLCTLLLMFGLEVGAIDAAARGSAGAFFNLAVFVPVAVLCGVLIAYTFRMRRV